MQYLGIDIGGTNTKYGVVTKDGKVEVHGSFPTDADKPLENFLKNLKSKCEKLKFNAIGVGCPDVDGVSGKLIDATNLSWENCNLKQKLQNTFPNIPIGLENDADVAAIGEKKFGSCQNEDNFLVITLGTGLGTSIYKDGQLVRGTEGGHMTIDPQGRICGCGARGHLEAYVSVRGIKLSCYDLTKKELSFKEIKENYFAGEERFVEVIDQTAKHLAHGISSMQTLFLPKKIILCGGVSSLGEDFRARVEASFSDAVYPPLKDLSTIELSKISLHNGAVLGASALAAELI